MIKAINTILYLMPNSDIRQRRFTQYISISLADIHKLTWGSSFTMPKTMQRTFASCTEWREFNTLN